MARPGKGNIGRNRLDMTGFTINPRLDATELAASFARHGRLQLRDFLAGDAAERLHANLRAREDWRQVFNAGDKVMEIDRAGQASLLPEKRRELDNSIHAAARYGFQYRYETIRVPDDAASRQESDDPVAALVSWLSQGEARDFLRAVTGADDITFADGQATAYSPGDFLTAHDDAVEGKNRRAAYVFGLTPKWRTEWGGLLLFHDGEGNVERGFAPALNTLNLFRVPSLHSVSEVTRAAGFRRYSVTGWLRTGSPG